MDALDPLVIEKFWYNVEQTDMCWNWTGALNNRGSPVIRISHPKTTEYSPRRVSLILAKKTISSTDRAQPLVCKNKLCVNPEHLCIGDEARFWAKVQKLTEPNGCWVWTAGQNDDMYGLFSIHENGETKHIRAHVYSWELFSGRSIPKGILVCHTCDHPYCVNPDHLFLGTTQDNIQDKISKGRQARGETNGRSKLTEAQVLDIRRLAHTMSRKELCVLFNLTRSNIRDIINRRSWIYI